MNGGGGRPISGEPGFSINIGDGADNTFGPSIPLRESVLNQKKKSEKYFF